MKIWKSWYYESTSSTMDRAKENCLSLKSNELGIVSTDFQTAGRGQNGRRWHAVDEGIYITLINGTSLSPKSLSGFSLMVACTVIQALDQSYNIRAFLKWPNDIFNDQGQKLGGILVETLLREHTYILTGIGLNIRGKVDTIKNNSDLQNESNGIIQKNLIIEQIKSNFASNLEVFNKDGFTAFMDLWNDHNYYRDQKINFSLSEVEENKVHGICVGVDQQGSLLIDSSGKILKFFSGRIVV